MSNKLLHRALAFAVFLTSAVQFFMTAQPSVSFWDPGELSAAAAMLEVPHPPGGPLFSLVGRFFYLLPIAGSPGFRMNCVSALASAFAVLFLYLVAVRLIENYRGRSPQSALEAVGTYASAAIGALAFSFCDTIWFNGVEANYFAAATVLFAAMTWLMLRWYEKAEQPGSSRYLLLIAYLVGLSGGVHLMGVLTIFTVVMLVVFRMYVRDDEACKKSAYIFLGHVALLLAIAFTMWSNQTVQQPPSSDEFFAYDRRFAMIMLGVSAVVVVLFWKKVVRRDSIYAPILAGGVALLIAYPGVIKKLPQLIHILSKDDSMLGAVILLALVTGLGTLAYWSGKQRKTVLHLASLSVLFVILGFSTYTMIMTRANVHPPMNENEPKTFSSLLTYLNREQYGEFPVFKRRWTSEPDRQKTWTSYTSDFDFFWRYQMNHMFTRYVLFNFAGSVSRDQDADWTWKQLYAIPLLVGLFGLYWHFRKDWRMATSFLLLFILMGYLIAFYQNQQEPQPRERDYFYGGAYYVFALWIALGVRGLLEVVAERLREPKRVTFGVAAVLLLATVFIPVREAQVNYPTHDRSRNWVPWDYSYNMLQSCEKDAILFTNGDNDTFPLWYLQDVEGVRRDVRIVNLSLVNTPWYIQQMKDKPYFAEAQAVPISIPDNRIANIQPVIWEPRMVEIPVPRSAYAQFGVADTKDLYAQGSLRDTSAVTDGKIQWRMPNTLQVGQTKAIRVQDLLVRNIIETTQWRRPIYFAVTCAPDSKIGIDDYLQYCGLVWRLTPLRATQQGVAINRPMLEESLLKEPTGFSRTPQYGYKFRCTAEPGVHFDENELRMLSGFRSSFRALALYEADIEKNPQKSAEVLDRMAKAVPWSSVPPSMEETYEFAMLYHRLGQTDHFNELASDFEKQFRSEVDAGAVRSPYHYGAMLQIYEFRRDYQKALDLLGSLSAMYPNDPMIKTKIDTLQALLKQSPAGSAAQ